ncbi:MAG: hypothetical protein AAF593_12925 [Planctomycetota bacterium]
MTPRFFSSRHPLPLLVGTLLVSMILPSPAVAQEFTPAEGNLKIRIGGDGRSPVVLLIDKGIIYEGDRKDEDAILYNFRSDLVRSGREREGDYLLRIRRNKVVDPEGNTIFTVSNGKLYGPDDRRTVLYTVGSSKLYRGDDRRGEPLYSWSGRGWNNQQAALIFAVLIALDLTPVEADN